MEKIFGAAVALISLIAWVGQVISWLAPARAAKWGLTEAPEDVDPAVHADTRGEAVWDTFAIWTLPAAGILMMMNHPWWPLFGLAGGGIYLYFSGRGIAVRLALQRRGIRIGKPETLKVCYFFLALWGLTAFAVIIASILRLV